MDARQSDKARLNSEDPAGNGEREIPMEEGVDIVVVLGELGDGALITESGLAKILCRHPASVKRAVDRLELPPPIHLMKRPLWTVGALLRHLERRLDDAREDRERAAAALDQHRR